MSEMVERVARALESKIGPAIDPRVCDMAARIAIDEMRDLPPHYYSVLLRHFNLRDDDMHQAAARRWYEAVIDKALI